MRQLVLTAIAQITLNGSGNGTAQAGPNNTDETWQVSVASVSCSTNNNEAQCRIYVGNAAAQNNYVDGTLSGSTGDSTDAIAGTIYPGQYIFAVWAGGDPGATAVMNIQGTRTVP